MFSLLLIFLPIASSLANNQSATFLTEQESDTLLAILESGESQGLTYRAPTVICGLPESSEENELIDISNDTVLQSAAVEYSTPTPSKFPITPPPGFNGTSFIAFEMPKGDL